MRLLTMIAAALLTALSAQTGKPPQNPAESGKSPAAAPMDPGAMSVPAEPAPVKSVYRGVSGIFPVYDINGEWVLIDRRSEGRKRQVKIGTLFLVVGSRATALFKVARPLSVSGAACTKSGPREVPGYVLAGRAKSWVGVPVIAIATPPGVRIDPKKASFYPMPNQVNNETYTALGKPLQEKIMDEVSSGKFHINPDDSLGQSYAQRPSPDNVHMNIDFDSTIHMARVTTAQALVTLTQISKSSRRCLWLALNDKLAGGCAEMPHLLMAETSYLNFIAYDPNHDGHPFIFAYTPKAPLWGHERWGFRATSRGPSVFLIDTLDPKCRERF